MRQTSRAKTTGPCTRRLRQVRSEGGPLGVRVRSPSSVLYSASRRTSGGTPRRAAHSTRLVRGRVRGRGRGRGRNRGRARGRVGVRVKVMFRLRVRLRVSTRRWSSVVSYASEARARSSWVG